MWTEPRPRTRRTTWTSKPNRQRLSLWKSFPFPSERSGREFAQHYVSCKATTLAKEDKRMDYTKPEVGIIGQAVHVIEAYPMGPLKISGGTEPLLTENPAYDFDEKA